MESAFSFCFYYSLWAGSSGLWVSVFILVCVATGITLCCLTGLRSQYLTDPNQIDVYLFDVFRDSIGTPVPLTGLKLNLSPSW